MDRDLYWVGMLNFLCMTCFVFRSPQEQHGRWLNYNSATKRFSATQADQEEDSKEMNLVKQSEEGANVQPTKGLTHGMFMSVPQLDMSAAAQLVVRDFTVS